VRKMFRPLSVTQSVSWGSHPDNTDITQGGRLDVRRRSVHWLVIVVAIKMGTDIEVTIRENLAPLPARQ
jgi:1-acyl-sn-glycerol-3-phosphate acyltransferase